MADNKRRFLLIIAVSFLVGALGCMKQLNPQANAALFEALKGKPHIAHDDDPRPEFDLRDLKNALTKGADPNVKNEWGEPILIAAIRTNYLPPEFTKTLIEAGADVNATDAAGRTALMFASTPNVQKLVGFYGVENLGKREITYDQRKEIVRALLSAKADVNKADDQGRTALMWAAGMLSVKDDVLHPDGIFFKGIMFTSWNSKETVLKERDEIMQLLKKAGADTKAVAKTGETVSDYEQRAKQLIEQL